MTLRLVGEPREAAVLAVRGTYEEYIALAGPSWRNEVDASVVIDVVTHRPIKYAAEVTCPALFQIADYDRLAPPHAAATAGRGARANALRPYDPPHQEDAAAMLATLMSPTGGHVR